MPFWMLVLLIVTLIALCWGGGWGIYRGVPGYGPFGGGLLAILGLVWLVILIIVFIGSGQVDTRIPR